MYTVFPWIADRHHHTPNDLEPAERERQSQLGRSFDLPTPALIDEVKAHYRAQTLVTTISGHSGSGALTAEQRFNIRLPLNPEDKRHIEFANGKKTVSTAEALDVTQDLLDDGPITSHFFVPKSVGQGKVNRRARKDRRIALQEYQDSLVAASAQAAEERQSCARGSDDLVSDRSGPELTEREQAQRMEELRRSRTSPQQKARPQQRRR